jgi:poly(3-hydroxyalkanoate) synthetase
MPKFEVTVIESRELVFEVEAATAESAGAHALTDTPVPVVKDVAFTRVVKFAERKLTPQELVFKMQIENIRRDYEQLDKYNKLPSGEIVDAASGQTILTHLAILHDELVAQSGLDTPRLGELDWREGVIAEHLGELAKPVGAEATTEGPPSIPPKPAPAHIISDPQQVWEQCATAFGWEYDPDYKGWIKKADRKPGKIHGEWDAYVRDLSAEDACNEEGIDTVEEAWAAVT